jgi:hypothetical protein
MIVVHIHDLLYTWSFHPKPLISTPHSIRIFQFLKPKSNPCHTRQSYKARKTQCVRKVAVHLGSGT